MIRIPEENSDFEHKLFKLIASGEAVLMVGVGSSKIVGYPLWSELILRLEKEVREIVKEDSIDFNFRDDGSEEDDLKYSSRLKQVLGEGRYGALMHQIFESKDCDDSHIRLLELPFRGILTTNYDPTLEIALFKINGQPDNNLVIDEGTANREINKFFQALNYGYDGEKRIAHLHGYYKQVKSLVLCIEDYNRKYGSHNPESPNWPLHKRIVWALMATRRIIYIGFSMTDPFFRMMHEIVSEDLGHFGSETHFMITRLNMDNEKEAAEQLKFAERVKRNYGIQTVFFEDNKEYDGLRKYLHKLNDLVAMLSDKTKSIIKTIAVKQKNIMVGNDELTDKLEKKARGKNKQIRDNEN